MEFFGRPRDNGSLLNLIAQMQLQGDQALGQGISSIGNSFTGAMDQMTKRDQLQAQLAQHERERTQSGILGLLGHGGSIQDASGAPMDLSKMIPGMAPGSSYKPGAKYNQVTLTPELISNYPHLNGYEPGDIVPASLLMQNNKNKTIMLNQAMIDNFPGLKKMGFEAGHEVPESVFQAQTKQPNNGTQQLNDEEMSALKNASLRKESPLPTSLIKSRGAAAKILAQALIQDPNYNPSESEISLATGKAGGQAKARIQQGKGHELASLAATVEDNLDKAESLMKNLAPTQIEAVNAAYQKGLKNIAGDSVATEFLTHIHEATALQASVLHGGGTPTDADLKLAQSYISPGLSHGAFAGMKKAVKYNNESRTQRLQGAGGSQKVVHEENKSGVHPSKLSDDDLLRQLGK